MFDFNSATALRRIRRRSRTSPTLNLGAGVGGAGLRHLDQRRDQPDSRQPLSLRAGADVRARSTTPASDGRPHLPDAVPSRSPSRSAACSSDATAAAPRISGCRRCISGIRVWCAATIPARSSRANAACRSDGSCPAFDRLIGSRVAIVNAEMRFPLWGAFGGSNFYGPLPVEMALFADSGVAWGQSNSQQFVGSHEVRCRASAWRCAPTCSGSRSRSSITSARSIDRAAAGSGSSI